MWERPQNFSLSPFLICVPLVLVELHLFPVNPHVPLLVHCSCLDVKCNGQILQCIAEIVQGKLKVPVNRLHILELWLCQTVSPNIDQKPD